MKKPIFERISEEAKKEAALLVKEAKAEAKQVLKVGKDAIEAQNAAELDKAKAQSKERVVNFKDRNERGLDNYKEQVRQEIVVETFDKVAAKLAELEGKELLAFVTNLINKENVSGSEVIHVSRRNFKKFVSALSSTKDGANLDLLNKANAKYKFTLSKEPTHVDEGFLLSAKQYDLIFDFNEIVGIYQRTHEQRIYNELFKDE
ncbi:MAG: V-type proton ATPase subunit E [Tenericutes bacterium ADurb.Bin024]|nr:MAG: V-type proton ATPase subunit E [Tenericutes bacterium ADurb.Bin024]